ncbi:signal peptidase II [Mycoplasma sp. Ms02]|uniref:signal peptidase II n=1 Tax=Mycoplasma sp. Ms02 TaxID=353851 RepID=UPI001C8A706D|nr:signal peptidase II [Mycoplasma sp. Ms02]QZE12237.1 signal peptidase II [Mycoplasma sp. Ms02]
MTQKLSWYKMLSAKIHDFWMNFVQYTKKHKRRIIWSYLAFLTVFAILLLIDQLTKTFIFKHGNIFESRLYGDSYYVTLENREVPAESIYPFNREDWIDWGIIGFRSIYHRGVTILPKGVNITFIQILSVAILVVILTVLYFVDWKAAIFLAIIAAGDAGNMLDRFIFKGHVKDILWVPFMEKSRNLGTFNFADIWIVLGCGLYVLYLLIEVLSDYISKKTTQHN